MNNSNLSGAKEGYLFPLLPKDPLHSNIFSVRKLLKWLIPAMLTIIFLFSNSRVFSQDLCSDLVIHLSFMEELADESPLGSSVTSLGAASFTTDRNGLANAAMNFNGVDNYLQIPHSSEIATGTTYSFAFWVKTSKTATQWIWAKGGSFGSRYQIGMTASGALQFQAVLTNVYFTYTTAAAFNDDEWHFVVIRRYQDINNLPQFDIWVDNIQRFYDLSNYQNLPATDNGNNMNIGRFEGSPSEKFEGSLDDMRLYNRQLTLAEMTELFNEIPAVNNPPQVIKPLPSVININEGYPVSSVLKLDEYFEDTDGFCPRLNYFLSNVNPNLIGASIVDNELFIIPVYDSIGTDLIDISVYDKYDTLTYSITFNVNEVTGEDLTRGLMAYYPFKSNGDDQSGFGFNPAASVPLTSDRFDIVNSSGNGKFCFYNWNSGIL